MFTLCFKPVLIVWDVDHRHTVPSN
jgi:hypothetical protein